MQHYTYECHGRIQIVFLTTVIVIPGLAAFSALFAATPPIKHAMLISGTGHNYVGIIDTTGTG